jgi:hypothetical protein
MARKTLYPTEHQEQSAVFDWIGTAKNRVPELDLMFAIPNQSQGNVQRGKYYKAEGQKKGVSDLFLPVARRGYHGMFIEMKRMDGKPTPEQEMWKARMSEQGYYAVICWGANQAIQKTSYYVGLTS